MPKITPEIGKRYIAAWKEAAILLQNTRATELPQIDTTRGLLSLLPAFEACVREKVPSNTSGLIEQQRIFSRSHSK